MHRDTKFFLNESGMIELSGSRYHNVFESSRVLPKLRPWMEAMVGLDVEDICPYKARPDDPPRPNVDAAFMEEVEKLGVESSTDGFIRTHHAHGHTCQEMYQLRYEHLPRVPDAVVFPTSHDEVAALMKAAVACNVCLIPFGGGTSVSGGLECPEHESRMLVVVSTRNMQRVKWVDKENMLACIEAGARGKDLEGRLTAQGVCLGHEPDSWEFSTVGGWIATRASGMKKNVYGNIEDIAVNIRCVTPTGVIEKGSLTPRNSTGPDVAHFVMGSEGILGIVTEVVFRMRPLPKARVFGSVVFPEFQSGVAFMREVARRRAQPASIRLVDNMQFQFGQALKPQPAKPLQSCVIDAAKKAYVTRVKGFEVDKMVACTLLFEGDAADVARQQAVIYELAHQFGGMKGGETNGIRGYFLTYMIAYLRDLGMNYYFMAESFETSVPWSSVLSLCHDVKEVIRATATRLGVVKPPFVSCRVTQTYDTGACVYFYFGIIYKGLPDPKRAFSEVEAAAREEILAHGGSVSHHHGVGKHRKRWMQAAYSDPAIDMLRAVKKAVDPQNIMAIDNIIPGQGDADGHH